jgi:phosphoribosyl 1,2-cyclic phosphodiesterase
MAESERRFRVSFQGTISIEPLDTIKVKFWGTRGSIPAPGLGTLKYGGNTACVEVRCGEELIIIDAGSGIVGLGTELSKGAPVKASILFSHLHWDHIQGIPFFGPAYMSGNEFKLYGSKDWDTKLEYALRLQMQSPSSPASLAGLRAKMEYIDVIEDGAAFKVGSKDQITVRSVELNHPNTSFALKIEYSGKNLVYASDTNNVPKPDEKLVGLARGTDLLIHDAQYTNEEYYGLKDGISREIYGHSTPEAAAKVAAAANVKKLFLFHHDFLHDDATIERMVQVASAIFPNTAAASEGMVIEL